MSSTAATAWGARPAAPRLDAAAGAEERDVEVVLAPAARRLFRRQPIRGRLEFQIREVDRAPAHVLVGPDLELLEERDGARDHAPAVVPAAAGRVSGREDVQWLQSHR